MNKFKIGDKIIYNKTIYSIEGFCTCTCCVAIYENGMGVALSDGPIVNPRHIKRIGPRIGEQLLLWPE